ncbi:MAG: aspartate carbamoyltransferase catalytic subunit [Planctomycetes bacterium]|nr:aspartate carbamoyltransferase catalytic subunit [Planctomycetota bacterium]
MKAGGKRDLVSIDDLSSDEIRELFRRADEFRADLRAWTHVCRGSIMATLFLEASTRTRLSFESAMLRLGGGVITAADVTTTSFSKGESLADTVRVVGGSYADIVVIRHPQDGAARVAAQYASVPVVNGGDGSHEHPTQTLCDLYTLWREKGQIEGLDVVLCGDLRYSRTIHSFAYALARFRANIITVPYPGFEMPAHVIERLARDFGVSTSIASVRDLPGFAGNDKGAAYLTSSRPHQLALFTKLSEVDVDHIDAIYMTRAQRERHHGETIEGYPRIDREMLKSERMRDVRLMHPLPRVDEIDYELDDDPRAIYFRQAAFGVPMRMALMAFLLGAIELDARPPEHVSSEPGLRFPVGGPRCRNDRCVTNGEGRSYLPLDFRLVAEEPPRVGCAYCSAEIETRFVGSATSHCFHAWNAPPVRRIRPENRVYFESAEQARAAGFQEDAELAGS